MPLAVFWSWPYSRVLDTEIASVPEHHLLIAQNLASALDAYYEDLENLLVAYRDHIAAGGGQEAKPLFEALHFRHVCVADAKSGVVLVEYLVADQRCPDIVPQDRLELLRSLGEGGGVGVSRVFRPAGEKARAFLSTRTGSKLVIGAIHTDFFSGLRQQVSFGRRGHAIIVDHDGQVIAHPFEDRFTEAIDLSESAPVRRLRSGDAGVDEFVSPILQEKMIAGFAATRSVGWGVLIPQPLAELQETASRFNNDAFFVLSTGVIFSLALAVLVSLQLSRRINRVAGAVHAIAQERDNVRLRSGLHLVNFSELKALENDVNRLAEDSASARQSQTKYNRELELANEKLRQEMEDRRTAEAAQKSSEARFKSLFESAPIPIREEDLSGMKHLIDGLNLPDPAEFASYLDSHPEFLEACSKEIVVVDANRASLEQHGYCDKSQMLSKVVRHLSPAAMKVVRMTVETIHSGAKGRSYETRITRADGSTRIVAATWSVIPGHEDTYARILLSSVDLTERLKSEEALRQAQKMEAVGQLTGGVAHDFNNLLTVIGGNLDLIKENKVLDAELMGHIEKAVSRGAELTQRLLAFSRKQPLLPRAIDLSELVVGMTGLLRRSLGEEIVVQIDLDEVCWQAMADPGQVEAALLNLALNSRDAMPRGGTLTISCHNTTVRPEDELEVSPGDYVALTISDTGTGMTPEVLARAYEPFFTTKEVGKGSGLGLSMVYGFAKQSGGDLRIVSSPEQGTSVSLFLPRTNLPSNELEEESTPIRKIDGTGLTVLILEDDPGVRVYVVKMMEAYNFSILTAQAASDARKALQSGKKIDMLISDVMLPGGESGPEFASELIDKSPDTEIIFISGRPVETHIEANSDLRGAHVLAKPFNRQDLVRLVEAKLSARMIR